MEENYEFRVSAEEAAYLKQLASGSKALSVPLEFRMAGRSTKLTVRLSRAEARQLSDLLGTRLAAAGFAENYEPNEQGRMLEDLIDRFYLP